MAAGEFRTPGVYIQEIDGIPRATPATSSIAGFVGFTKKGPTDEALFVTSFSDFERKYGSFYLDNYLPLAIKGYFDAGGTSAYIARCLASDAVLASTTISSIEGGPATAGSILGTNTEPFNFAVSDTVVVDVDNGGDATITFSATAGSVTGSGGTFPTSFSGGETLILEIDNSGSQTVTFTSGASTAADVAGEINTGITGGYAEVVGGEVKITSDVLGQDSEVDITGGTGRATIGLAISTGTGTSSPTAFGNIAAMTAAEAALALNGLSGATAAAEDGAVRITSDTTGVASEIDVNVGGSTNGPTILGFDDDPHVGTAASTDDSITVAAANKGTWGNSLKVNTTRWSTTTTATLADTDTSVTLASIREVQVGDIAVIGDWTGNHAVVHIRSITPSTKTISFVAIPGSTLTPALSSGAAVASSSMHRRVTTSTAATLTTDTSIQVADSNNIRTGSIIIVDDGTNIKSYTVASVAGTTLNFASALGTAFTSGAVVSTQEFYLQIQDSGTENTPHMYLSMSSTNTLDYIETRLGGDDNPSYTIELTDESPSPTLLAYGAPRPVSNVMLSGGADGSALVAADYIGTESPATGMYLLKSKDDLNFFSVPGVTTPSVLQEAVTIAEDMGSVEVIGTAPLATTDVDDVLGWRNITLGIDSSHFVLYFPWLKERDIFNANRLISVPPEGKVSGVWSLVADTRGVHVAPANIILPNTLDLTHEVTDAEQDLLNPRGVNVIRRRPGRGIRVWGARTLTSRGDAKQQVAVRRLISFITKTVEGILEPFLFQPITDPLFENVERVVGNFFHGLFLQNMFGSSNEANAYFVKCDRENNTAATIALQQVIVDVGINPANTAEFIVFRIGEWDGGTSISEEIARRG